MQELHGYNAQRAPLRLRSRYLNWRAAADFVTGLFLSGCVAEYRSDTRMIADPDAERDKRISLERS